MYEPPIEFSPFNDTRPVWVYLAALIILLLLPWSGVESLFGWNVVQTEDWGFYYAPMLALPLLLFLEFPLRLLDRIRGKGGDED